MVGWGKELQQTPLAVTDDPPSELTLPPPILVCLALSDISVVESVGTEDISSDFFLQPKYPKATTPARASQKNLQNVIFLIP
jgi:hypothetical protein